MDLFSGYSDSAFNPFSGLQNAYGSQAQSNDYLNSLNSQITGRQYDPFAQSGGFGAQTSYYSGLGRDYTTATGGNIYGVDPGTWSTMSPGDQQTFNRAMGGGIGSDAARVPNQPDPTPFQSYVGGYNPFDPSSYAPSAQQNVGGGGYGSASSGLPPLADTSGGGGASIQPPQSILTGDFRGNMPYAGGGGYNPYDPSSFAPSAQPNIGGGYGGNANSYGVDPGMWGRMSAGDQATFNRAMQASGAQGTPSGQGGIGSDTSRDQIAWTLAQSSPYAGAQGPPANGPYPNLGYNPGFGGDFAAGGGMQQYNPQQMYTDLQRTLGDIGGGGRSWQSLGMSPSDVQIFTNAVGQDAANAWLQKGSQ
jgi:hypothetical protein